MSVCGNKKAMEISDTSSDEEYDIYTNAASKLNALNRQAKSKIKINDDRYDDDDCVIQEPKKVDLIATSNDAEKKGKSEDCIGIEDSDESSIEILDDSITSTEEDPPSPEENRRVTRNSSKRKNVSQRNIEQSKRTTRSSGKKNNAITTNVETAIVLDDSIDETNQTLDSFQLSQEGEDSYILIGSPPSSKKNEKDDYEVSVKVLWKSNELKRFDIRRYETFQKVFMHFAEKEGVSENQILITKKDKCINPFDTPASIDWSIIDILEGGVVSADIARKDKGKNVENDVQENNCKIKVQTSDKRTLTVTLRNNEQFTTLLHNCSEQLNIPETKIKFYFDGELIDIDETPESLDLDEEACIDLKIIK